MEYGMIIRLGFHRGSHGWYRRGGVSGVVVIIMVVIMVMVVIVVTITIVVIVVITMTMTVSTTIIEWL